MCARRHSRKDTHTQGNCAWFRLVKQGRFEEQNGLSLLFELMILFAKSGFGHKARGSLIMLHL